MSEETAEKPEEEATEKLVEEIVEKPTVEEKQGKVEKRRKGVYSYYELREEKLKRLRTFCERCGPGYFMADHDDRYTCGHCGFTRYKRAEEKGE